MQQVIDKEKHKQQVELLKEQNKISEEKYNYLKETDQKIKIAYCRMEEKREDKNKVVKMMQAILFKQPEKQILKKKQQKIDNKYIETNEPVNQAIK